MFSNATVGPYVIVVFFKRCYRPLYVFFFIYIKIGYSSSGNKGQSWYIGPWALLGDVDTSEEK